MEPLTTRNSLEKFTEELSFLIRARYPLLYLVTYEERRTLGVIEELGKRRPCQTYQWSRTEGTKRGSETVNDVKDPAAILKWYEDTPANEKSVLVLKDFHPYFKEPVITRKLRDLSAQLKERPKNIIFLSPVSQLPIELQKEVTILEVPLPSRVEISTLVNKATGMVDGRVDTEALIDASTGLTYDEIENVFAKSLVSTGKLERKLIHDEKKQIVKRSGLLEFIESGQSSSSKIGGLGILKDWLNSRKSGFSKEAREIGLPLPKGLLLVGVPGCGKSLTAMTVGQEWGIPVLRLDLGRIFSGIVGSSEGNIRSAIATCESVAPCVLWVDEIEKGLSGVKGGGQGDSGTSSRVFGTLLTWMQDKKSSVFVVATANDISQLPPEFLRKGRFDEIFFVDLPTTEEREAIFQIHFKNFGWELPDLNLKVLSEHTEGFSGAEIEQAVVAARYLAFGKKEPFLQEHLVAAVAETVPLSKTMGDRLDHLREWAKHRARAASHKEGNPNDGEDSLLSRSRRLEMIVK